MVKPFQFARIPKILFRNGMVAVLPGLAETYGKRIILVLGKNSFVRSEQAARLFYDLEKKGINYHLVSITGEPSPEVIDSIVKKFENEDIDLIAGIGGGSVIDAAKAISAMKGKKESVTEFLEGVGNKVHPGTKLPFIAVPTTSGTGSEVTKNAVISSTGKNGFKRSLRHDNMVPDIALIDPELTLTCSPELTAASGMDCFTQLVEAYLSGESVAYTEALAYEGLKAVKECLVNCFTDGYDIEARAGMSFAALTSGICLANAGLGVVHGFASSLGGRFEIPHGLVCGSLMAKSNEVIVKKLRNNGDCDGTLRKYAILGDLFLIESGKSNDYYIDGFINYLHYLTSIFRFPGLKKFSFKENDLEDICKNTDNKNNPVILNEEELTEILSSRFF